MRVRLEQVHVLNSGLQVEIEVRYRQASWLKKVHIPWKWLATDDIASGINNYRVIRHLTWEDDVRPMLPLEVWE